MKVNSVSGKNWEFKKFDYSEQRELSEKYSLSEIVSKLIAIRKNNINNVDFFLNPTIKNLLPNPYTIKDMQKAVNRSYNAICKSEKIGIFGDYDVDGASSTALLSRYYLSINQKVITYIPDRKKEGYGPSIEGFNSLIRSGSNIIFTVDCGTLSFKPIIEAQKQKVDVVVLDHHQSEVKIPNACAVVNPNRYDDSSNLKYLCAAGVCFMFLIALNKKLRDSNWFKVHNVNEPDILNLLDLVSLATICDVVPLVDLNRAIVKQGLKVIKKRSNLGLKTLYDLCNIKSQPTTYDLGFKLGPRINAGGRVGKSSHGSELLTSNDPQKAYKIALDLDNSNSERQNIEKVLSKKVDMEVKNYHNHPVLVLSGTNWHEGIIGIVASRVKEKYNKPTILISLNGNLGKGSARSIDGFDIGAQIIKAVQSNILERGGGHKMAGGFTLQKENIDNFRNFLINSFEKSKVSSSQDRLIYLDSKIAPSALNEDFYKEINSLAPFGSGNNEPKFVIEDLNVIKSDIVGENHIKSILKGKDGSSIKSFAWNAVDSPLASFLNVKNKKKICIAGRMSLNEYRGMRNIEFIIEDISLS
jgi:single-stranded-DNA-specific exonuclease